MDETTESATAITISDIDLPMDSLSKTTVEIPTLHLPEVVFDDTMPVKVEDDSADDEEKKDKVSQIVKKMESVVTMYG